MARKLDQTQSANDRLKTDLSESKITQGWITQDRLLNNARKFLEHLDEKERCLSEKDDVLSRIQK